MIIKLGKKKWRVGAIEPRDWLLIIGLTMAPMTGLRVWKIGPGEVLCLLWGWKYLLPPYNKNSDIKSFFVLFLTALLLGTAVGTFVAPRELRFTDLLTWLYLAVIAVLIYNGLKTKSLSYNESLLFVFALCSVIWYMFLYFYSRNVSRFFMGAPLWYSSRRFSGGGTNPHQIAVLFSGLSCVFMRALLKKNHVFISLCGLISCVFLVIQTDSSTGLMAVTVGILISVYIFLEYKYPRYKKRIRTITLFIIVLACIVGASFFKERFISWVASDKNGLERFSIFSSYAITFKKSPMFGLGPGIHGWNGYIEYHNTYIEILAATGIVGGIVFCVYSYRLFKKVLESDRMLFPILVAMYTFGLAGFAMRRLVYWGLIATITVISDQILEINNYKLSSK